MARFLGIFCRHEWEEKQRYTRLGRVRGTDEWNEIGVMIELRCKYCGDIRQRDISV